MDEEKVTQTAMEPAQQPKPKAGGGQRTQGKTAPGTGRGRMAKPHASNSNTAHRKTGTQKQKSEPQNTKSPQEPKTRAEQAGRIEAATLERIGSRSPKRRAAAGGGKRRAKLPKPEAKPQQYVEPRPDPTEARNLPLMWPNRLKQPPRRKCRKRRCRNPKSRSCPRPRSRRSRRMTNRN